MANLDFVRVRAHGKINLGLDVLGKREDGYHEVRMIMQQVGLYDGIDIRRIPNGRGRIQMETNLKYLPVNENNLAYVAAKILMDEFCIRDSVHIKIKKMIPVAAGMAGGSADAAAVLIGINRLFDLRLDREGLMKRGLTLGADVPYCIMGGTALAEGIGEVLTPLRAMPPCYIVVAKPPINISTKLVYGALDMQKVTKHPDIDGLIDAINRQDVHAMAQRMGNVLADVTIPQFPVVGELVAMMEGLGACGAMMSGSGPTVFGIFDDVDIAKNAYYAVRGHSDCRQVYITDGGNGDERY